VNDRRKAYCRRGISGVRTGSSVLVEVDAKVEVALRDADISSRFHM